MSGRWPKALLQFVLDGRADWGLALVVASTMGWAATARILTMTGGQPAVPLDDSFIHFQFARTFAELRPFAYVAGAAPVPGATSLLWPLLLAPFYAAGFKGLSLIWVAWAFGWASFAALIAETTRAARRLCHPVTALFAGAMVACSGGIVWYAGSGMEVVPLAWLLMWGARLGAEWWEDDGPPTQRARWLLMGVAVATACMRPEGVITAVSLAAVLALAPRGGSRFWALVPFCAPLIPPLVNWCFTGSASTTTAQAKWLFAGPYPQHGWERTVGHLEILYNTLLNGEVWAQHAIPNGARPLAILAGPVLAIAALRGPVRARPLLILAVALGLLLPTSYDTFLVNRLRYLWPFVPAWLVGLARLADDLGDALASLHRYLTVTRAAASGWVAYKLALLVPVCMNDLAVSANAIRLQQVSLAEWARTELPKDALIGVNDTGALTYLSERRTFDLVGLTTLGEARYWAAGAGARFEHWERTPKNKLPTHLIMYPDWLAAPMLVGEELTSRTVYGASILGGVTMVACLPRWEETATGAKPSRTALTGELIDELDVADLDSEAAHGWDTKQDWQHVTLVWNDFAGHADGGRKTRSLDRFTLKVARNGKVVVRVVPDTDATLELWLGGVRVGEQRAPRSQWLELQFQVPSTIDGSVAAELRATSGTYATLHYWSTR